MTRKQMRQFIDTLEDINNPLHYYWEECSSVLLWQNFIIVLN